MAPGCAAEVCEESDVELWETGTTAAGVEGAAAEEPSLAGGLATGCPAEGFCNVVEGAEGWGPEGAGAAVAGEAEPVSALRLPAVAPL